MGINGSWFKWCGWMQRSPSRAAANGGNWRDEAPCGVPQLGVTQASVSKKAIREGHKGLEGSQMFSKTGLPGTAQETARANNVEVKVE